MILCDLVAKLSEILDIRAFLELLDHLGSLPLVTLINEVVSLINGHLLTRNRILDSMALQPLLLFNLQHRLIMLHVPLLLPCLLLHDPLDTLFQRIQLLGPILWLMGLFLLKLQIIGSLRFISLLRLHIL